MVKSNELSHPMMMAPAAFDWKDVTAEHFDRAESWHNMTPGVIESLRSSGSGLQIKSDGTSRDREKEDYVNSTTNTRKRGKIEQWSEREPKRQWCVNNQH